MPEDKKGKKMPDKDYFRTYDHKGKKKRAKKELTEVEKAEFQKAFSDDADGDVKTYTPGKKDKKPAPVKTAPVESKPAGEDMYTLPEFDADEFFSTLGLDLGDSVKKKKDSQPQTESADKTQVVGGAPEETVPPVYEKEPEKETADTMSRTRHFTLSSITRKIQVDKGRKNFRQNFRVLSKDKGDRAIIEAAPAGNGGRAFADSVKTKKGEDIFEAVEKAYLEKDEGDQVKLENVQLRKERNAKGAEKAAEIRRNAEAELVRQKNSMIVYGALFAVSLILTLFFRKVAFYPVFGIIVSAVLCALNFSAFKKSFSAIRNLSAVPETALVIMSFFVLVHNISVIVLDQQSSIYTVCLILACFMRAFSSYFSLKNRVRVVLMATKSKSLSLIQRVPVKSETSPLAPNVENGDEPDIFYCAKAFLDCAVDEPDYDATKENKQYIFSMTLVLLVSLIVGLVCFATQLTGISFVSAFTATVCALLPVMYDPVSRFIFYNKGKEMLQQGACVSGREALQSISDSDGFVLDARDVFAADISRFRKSAVSSISQNDSAVFAAMLLNEADSVLAPCFDSFMSEMNIKLPAIENFQYEERLGYSAWILDRKVLVGNRQMLINHSISVPSKEHEKAYGKNRFVMYVAVDGEITATFLVNYKVLSSLKRYSRDFNKTGLVLMISSKEAFLNEEIVSGKLSVDISSVKVLSSKATQLMEKFNGSVEDQVPTGLLCSKKKKSIMHLIMGCYNLTSSDKLVRSLMTLGQILGAVLLLVSPILRMPVFLNPVMIVLIRLIWCVMIDFVVEHKK